MKTVNNWDDLTKFGIEPLTGEACGLGYRILCDITAGGKAILEKCLGLHNLGCLPNWNQATGQEPHIGSVMLAPQLLVPVGIFALLETGCTEVWLYHNGALLGIEPGDTAESVDLYRNMRSEALARTFAYRGTAGARNIHVMSGRIE